MDVGPAGELRRSFNRGTRARHDGHGINGPDEYRTRLATFTEVHKRSTRDGGTGLADHYGPMMVEAPAMVEALKALTSAASVVTSKQHAGNPISAAHWSDLWRYANEARAILQRIERSN